MEFTLQELERIDIGQPFSVIVDIKNNSDEVRTINAALSAGSVFYTGIKANIVKKAQGDFKVKPKSCESTKKFGIFPVYLLLNYFRSGTTEDDRATGRLPRQAGGVLHNEVVRDCIRSRNETDVGG